MPLAHAAPNVSVAAGTGCLGRRCQSGDLHMPSIRPTKTPPRAVFMQWGGGSRLQEDFLSALYVPAGSPLRAQRVIFVLTKTNPPRLSWTGIMGRHRENMRLKCLHVFYVLSFYSILIAVTGSGHVVPCRSHLQEIASTCISDALLLRMCVVFA